MKACPIAGLVQVESNRDSRCQSEAAMAIQCFLAVQVGCLKMRDQVWNGQACEVHLLQRQVLTGGGRLGLAVPVLHILQPEATFQDTTCRPDAPPELRMEQGQQLED